jgi:cytochrome c-type biogenesis protein CcmF
MLFTALMVPVILLMPFGPFARWQQENWGRFVPLLKFALTLTVLATAIAYFSIEDGTLKTWAGVAGATWVMAGTAIYAWKRWQTAAPGRRFTAEMSGMLLAHFGVGVFVAGVLLVESTSIERDLALKPGESTEIRGFRFQFDGVAHREGPNFEADRGTVQVYDGDRLVATLHPEKRAYKSGGQIMTEAGIDPGLTRDLYVALGEPLGDGEAWAVRVYVKPFIRWIWFGALLMTIAGFVVAFDRRFRRVPAAEPVAAPGAASPDGLGARA